MFGFSPSSRAPINVQLGRRSGDSPFVFGLRLKILDKHGELKNEGFDVLLCHPASCSSVNSHPLWNAATFVLIYPLGKQFRRRCWSSETRRAPFDGTFFFFFTDTSLYLANSFPTEQSLTYWSFDSMFAFGNSSSSFCEAFWSFIQRLIRNLQSGFETQKACLRSE